MKRQEVNDSRSYRSIVVWAVCIMMFLTGCQNEEQSSDVNYFYHSMNRVTETETEAQESEKGNLYLIVAMNSADQVMRVYSYSDGREYQYYYGMKTDFRDKYGQSVSVKILFCGTAAIPLSFLQFLKVITPPNEKYAPSSA